MKKAIEKVIAELEKQKAIALQKQKESEGHWAFKQWGIEIGLDTAISELKAVIANETNSQRNTDGCGKDDGTREVDKPNS